MFGVPLMISIKYAKTTVGYVDDDGIKHSKAGAIPIVVSKCGSYLKKYGNQFIYMYMGVYLLFFKRYGYGRYFSNFR